MIKIDRKILVHGLLYLGIFVVAAGISYTTLTVSKIFVKTGNTPVVNNRTPLPSSPVPKDAPFNVLLLGYGGGNHDGTYLTDSIIILNIDPKTKKVAMISVPRDTWISSLNDKINAAYVKGIDQAKDAVSQVTGLTANYFVSVDFSEFSQIIDTLGGVNVNVPQTFDDNFFPTSGMENDSCGKSGEEIDSLKTKYTGFDLEKQFTCRYEKLHFNQGNTVMNGETALKFTRSRHSDTYGGDFYRSERQFAVLKAIESKLISLNAITKSGKLINQLSQMVRTDLGISQINTIIDLLGNPQDYKTAEIHLTDANVFVDSMGPAGQFILIPKTGAGNFKSIQDYIVQQMGQN